MTPIWTARATALRDALAARGLPVLAAVPWPPRHADVSPAVLPTRTATLLLCFSAGDSLAQHARLAPEPHPIDAWAERVLRDAVAATDLATAGVTATVLGIRDARLEALPLQRLALDGGGLWQGRHGLLLHPRYGSWLALRGALALDAAWPLQAAPLGPSPCDACPDLCRRACPAGTYTGATWDAAACARERLSGPPCDTTCAVRDACPVGTAHRYLPAWRRHHAAASLATIRAWQERG